MGPGEEKTLPEISHGNVKNEYESLRRSGDVVCIMGRVDVLGLEDMACENTELRGMESFS